MDVTQDDIQLVREHLNNLGACKDRKLSIGLMQKLTKYRRDGVITVLARNLLEAISMRGRLDDRFFLPLIDKPSGPPSFQTPFAWFYYQQLGTETVIYKVLHQFPPRLKDSGPHDGRKAHIPEVDVWAKVSLNDEDRDGPRVLPLRGVSFLINEDERNIQLVLCSPYCQTTLKQHNWTSGALFVRSLFLDIAGSLAFIHSENIVHGDLHPNNVVHYNTKWCFLDFGFSKFVNEWTSFSSSSTLTQDERMTSVIRKQAPEVRKGVQRNKESDIFLFGNIVYEYMSRCTPVPPLFENDAGHPPRPEEMKNPEWGVLWDIVCDCWSADPRNRPLAQDLADRLKKWPIPGLDGNTDGNTGDEELIQEFMW